MRLHDDTIKTIAQDVLSRGDADLTDLANTLILERNALVECVAGTNRFGLGYTIGTSSNGLSDAMRDWAESVLEEDRSCLTS